MPDANAKAHHGIAMRFGQPLSRANRAALGESRDDLNLLLSGGRSLSAPYLVLPSERGDNELASFDVVRSPGHVEVRWAGVLAALPPVGSEKRTTARIACRCHADRDRAFKLLPPNIGAHGRRG